MKAPTHQAPARPADVTVDLVLAAVDLVPEGRVVTYGDIAALVALAYGDDYEGFDRNIDSYIKRLRQKIEKDPKNPQLIKTIYGAGYIFLAEVDWS